jgi:hypothetical protein
LEPLRRATTELAGLVITAGNRLDGFWNSRPESAGMPSCQGVAAKCSASSAPPGPRPARAARARRRRVL